MQPFFDLYVENPETIRLIVAICDEKVLGRCLVFTTTTGREYYDTIYATIPKGAETREHLGVFEDIVEYCELSSYLRVPPLVTRTVRINYKFHKTWPFCDTFSWIGVDKEGMYLRNTTDYTGRLFMLYSHKGYIYADFDFDSLKRLEPEYTGGKKEEAEDDSSSTADTTGV